MMEAGHIRVPLVQPGTRPELAEIEARIAAERGRVSLLYQVLLHSGPIASGWEPAALRELVILRVAVLNGAEFEFEAHVLHAQAAGVGVHKIAATRVATLDPAFDPVERLVLQLTDHMTRDVVVPEALMDKLRKHFDDQGLVELVATVAAYNMVSRVLVALGIRH